MIQLTRLIRKQSRRKVKTLFRFLKNNIFFKKYILKQQHIIST